MMPSATALRIERVALTALKAHPRNYRGHPPAQLEHLIRSITEHGVYRPIVLARDGTILAGHGVVAALEALGRRYAACVRLDLDPDEALAIKVLVGDNEVDHLAEEDDRALADLLRGLSALGDDLVGTGFDAASLATLVLATRPAAEVPDEAAAAEWAGQDGVSEASRDVVLTFEDAAGRDRFCAESGLVPVNRAAQRWVAWWKEAP